MGESGAVSVNKLIFLSQINFFLPPKVEEIMTLNSISFYNGCHNQSSSKKILQAMTGKHSSIYKIMQMTLFIPQTKHQSENDFVHPTDKTPI